MCIEDGHAPPLPAGQTDRGRPVVGRDGARRIGRDGVRCAGCRRPVDRPGAVERAARGGASGLSCGSFAGGSRARSAAVSAAAAVPDTVRRADRRPLRGTSRPLDGLGPERRASTARLEGRSSGQPDGGRCGSGRRSRAEGDLSRPLQGAPGHRAHPWELDGPRTLPTDANRVQLGADTRSARSGGGYAAVCRATGGPTRRLGRWWTRAETTPGGAGSSREAAGRARGANL